jgi:caspase domain-containing protein
MNPRRFALAAALILGVLAAPVHAAAPVQRFLLVIGANAGGGERAKLQYAVSDAERFARVMVELGGVPAAHEVVLRQPSLKDLVDAFDALNARVLDARRTPGAGRTEVIVYYSGHADEQGLLLAGDRYSYRSLRDRLDQIPADVRIAVLDACASGASRASRGARRARPSSSTSPPTCAGMRF